MKKNHGKQGSQKHHGCVYSRLPVLSAGSLVVLMGITGQVQAEDTVSSADIKASVTLISNDNCIPVVGAATNPMEMKWTRGADGKGVATLASNGAPSEVVVTVTGGGSCSLNTLRLTTVMGSGALSGPDYDGQNFTWAQPVPGVEGGYWRFLPYLARAQFFTGDDASTGPGTGTVHWHSPTPGYDLTFGTTPQQHGGDSLTLESMGGDVMFLTDQYVEEGGALLMDKGVNTGYFTTDKPSETYKSAVLGFGALMATGPEKADFTRDDSLVQGSGQVNMSWTVSVSLT